jgi:hypothetical protein
VITRSRFVITAAESRNGPVVWFNRAPRSVTGNFSPQGLELVEPVDLLDAE